MRVLYFHQHFSLPSGAAGIRSYQMARKLISKGHEVTMVCGSYAVGKTGLDGPFVRGKREGKVDGIDVIEIDLTYSNNDGFLRRSITFLKFAVSCVSITLSRKYDLVFASSTPLTVGIPGIVAKLVRRKPFVFEVRDLWPELPKAMGVISNPILLRLMSWLEFASYRLADGCIGLSPGIVEGIVSRGKEASSVAMIPNGCDISLLRSLDEAEWRHEEVSEDDFLAVFAGSHGIANGLDAVLEAARVLKERGNERIKIVFVGDGKLKTDLQNEAKEKNLDNVIFLDPIPKVELVNLLRRSDMGLQILANIPAFYYGTSPNKFFDYLASGLPVLVNYPGWVADLIEDWGCGLAVEPENAEAFANGLEMAAENRSTLSQWGERSMDLAVAEFDRDVQASKWVQFVEDVYDAVGKDGSGGKTVIENE